MKKKATALATVLLLAATFFVLTACRAGGGTTEIRLGEVTHSLFYTPEYVAFSKGFFKDEGLDVKLQTIPGGDKVMTALLSNGIDVGLVGSETSIYVYQQGANDPVINFAQLTQTDGTFLVSRKPMPNFQWDDLKGSTFLGQRKGGMPQMAGEFGIRKHGLDPHKDMTMIQNIDFANIASAFSSGTGDYVQLFEPTASIFEQEGRGYVVASFGKESGHLPYTVFMSKQSYIQKHKDAVQKFTNAVYRAQQWVNGHSVAEIADAVASDFPDTKRPILESVIKRYKEQGSFAADPIVDKAEWDNLQNIMQEAGELKERVDHDKLVDTSFAQKAIDNGN